jgi:predicted nucleic acid-binding protein
MIHAYWFEDNDALSLRVQQIYSTMQQRGDLLCSSVFVLSELLVGPLKDQNLEAVEAIEQFFDSDAVSMLPYERQCVRTFAELRANHGVKSLDSLHLAIAASAGVDLFLTHDRRLHKLIMPGLPFIASLDTDLF